MTYFNRGGGFGGGRDSGRPSFSNRDRSERPEMHKAICDQCGKACEVPFRPNGSKPIFCSQCFEAKSGGFDRDRDRTTVRRFDRDGSSRPSYNNSAPRSFGNNNSYGGGREEGVLKIANNNNDEQMSALNRKLDKIIELLTPKQAVVTEAPVEKKAPKKAKKVEVVE